MKNYHLKCKNIYHIAKNIFGDVVISAYVEHYEKTELQRIANKYKKIVAESCFLSYDADTIVLEFKNGNKVRFTNSEWASISTVNEEDFNVE